ncbi:MAG: hypothetical protein FWG39_02820 [Alphaproteobacteria bacterium]|nr:hypothetical protein [Alphaproteobacteria bacterium]
MSNKKKIGGKRLEVQDKKYANKRWNITEKKSQDARRISKKVIGESPAEIAARNNKAVVAQERRIRAVAAKIAQQVETEEPKSVINKKFEKYLVKLDVKYKDVDVAPSEPVKTVVPYKINYDKRPPYVMQRKVPGARALAEQWYKDNNPDKTLQGLELKISKNSEAWLPIWKVR